LDEAAATGGAVANDADAIAAVHHTAWVQTYSGLLLDAVLPARRSAELWVVEDNPRARRFYDKHGFAADGARFVDALDIVEIRMVRDS
jgi:hypothetical protein